MSYSDPTADFYSSLSGIGGSSDYDLGGLGDIGPITPTLPRSMRALATKYSRDLPSIRANFPSEVVNSLLDYETQRAQRGVMPLSRKQTRNVLKAAATNQAVSQPASRDPWDILGNIASDVGGLVTSLPKLPEQLANEIRDLPNIGQRIREGGGGLEGLLSAPGIRLIPGAYTAKNLLTGDFNEIATHPVMSLLDVLPAVKETGLVPKLLDTGTGAAFTEQVDRLKGMAGRTIGGQLAKETWGLDTRGTARTIAEKAIEVVRSAHPGLAKDFTDDLSRIRQEGTRASVELGKAVGEDPVRHAQLYDALANNDLDSVPDLTDTERAAVHHVSDVQDQYRQFLVDVGGLHYRTIDGYDEVLSSPQARRVDAVREARARRATFTGLRSAILNPESADLSTLRSQVQSQLEGTGTVAKKKQLAQGYVHALGAAGYDTSASLEIVRGLNKTTAAEVLNQVDAARGVAGGVRTLKETGTPTMTTADRWLNDHRTFTPATLDTFDKKVAAAEGRVVPARWQPTVVSGKQERIRGAVEARLRPDDPALPEVMRLVDNRNYGTLRTRGLITDDELRTYERESVAAIQDLRRQGFDPRFVHQVSPGQAKALHRPTLSTVVPKPSQLRDRINDWTPTTKNLAVSITHQGVELAREPAARAAMEAIRDSYTTPLHVARDELTPVAERVARRRGTDPGYELEKLMNKSYVRFSETENGFVAGAAKSPRFSEMQKLPDDELLLPRHLANALDRISTPSPISSLLDPVTGLFRYSVLPFSIRFQVNNIGGGALMSALEDPRVLTKLDEGYKFAKSNRKMMQAISKGEDAVLPEDVQAVWDSMSPSMKATMGSLEFSATPDSFGSWKPEQVFKWKAGQQLGQLAQAAFGKVKSAADWSFGINQMGDDMYRAAAYLSGRDRALTAGMSAADAARAGEELVAKIQPRWLEMTPMERSVLRPLIPFYSFMSHIFRYATRYPIDHPFRTATIAAFTRAEHEDFGTGLPQLLASAFFLGSPDSKGNQTILDVGAMNPFRNLGDDLTLGGFLSETNPIFKVLLSGLGYDARSRGPNLYPELEYDPITGGMRARPTNLPGMLGSLATGFVPPLQLLGALTGTSSTFKSLMSSNPDAAQRMLLSSIGIPLLWRDINVPQQTFKAELNREKSEQAAFADALRSGDYSDAKRYPSLAPYLSQIHSLSGSGGLEQYKPNLQQSQQQILANMGYGG